MKVQAGSSSHLLREGDTITFSITHQVDINGANSWVKYESTTTIANESDKEAHERIVGFVNTQVMDAIYKVVETVEAVGK